MKSLAAVALAALFAMSSNAADSIYDIPLKDIHGKDTSLAAYKGKPVLIVNVASKCGLTPQYDALEKLHREFKDEGLVVVGFPCNDFAGQEPGTNEEILAFCKSTYDVSFPMFDKIKVLGDDKHPLYEKLTGAGSPFPGAVEWNFGKFLISPSGEIVERFTPRTKPDDAKVVSAIKKQIAAAN